MTDHFSYNGPMYGFFAGLTWRHFIFIVDTKLTLTRMPVNLADGRMKWIPGFGLGQYS